METRGKGRASRGGRARGEPSDQQSARPGGGGPHQQRGGGPPQQRGPGGGGPPQQRGPGGGGPPQQRGPGGSGGPSQPRGPPQGAWGQPQGAWGPPQGAWGPSQGQQPPQQQQAPQQQPRPQGAWGRQPQGAGQQQPMASREQGRGSRVGGGDDSARSIHEAPKVVMGAGDPGLRDTHAKERGGGNGVRGRSNRNEIIHTKPAEMKSKQGSTGQPIRLTANYFKLINKPDWCLQQYRVDFQPETDDTRIKKKLVQIAYKRENDIGGFLFDGTAMFTALRLQPDPMIRVAKLEDQDPVTISVRWVNEVKWGDWHYLQIFNILVRKCLHLMELQLVNRSYYDPNAQITIPDHRLCLWPGYFTAIRQYEKDIMMNSELTFKVMRTDNVYDLLLQTVDRDGRHDTNSFVKKVVGSVVLTFYNNKTYSIDDVDFKTTPQSKFARKNGEEITYMDYYKQRYAINIQVPSQPMLISRSKKREIRAGMPEVVFLVPELCQLTGLSDDQRANFNLMSAFSKHTRIGPSIRQDKLMDFVRKLKGNPQIMQELKLWDLDISTRLVEFEGRVLNQERMVVGSDVKFPSGDKADWTYNLRSNPMFVTESMDRLAVITPTKLQNETDDFMRTLNKAASGMKWSLRNYKLFGIPNDRSGSYLEKLEEIINQERPTLIMCVLMYKTADRYNAIKKKCCVDRGVPTQVVVARNLSCKGVMSVATKIAIQMNCKIGGAPWAVTIPIKGLMVVGYDVCRDTSSRSKCFGGMVASINQNCTRYFSGVSEHEYEEELSNNFASFMLLACQKYRENNGCFPAKIVLYRDGVGDGQIPLVLEHEVKNIVSKLTSEIYTGENQPLKMAFVVVSKRINTRIFDRQNNPPPGTVVDNTITLPERYDFFIVSQCVNQGTVAPTNFNVIFDHNVGLAPDHMQMLTYKMCHMYYNWSGTVRVPAPCQYAHKLAFLTAQSLHRPANRKLETLLYYL